MTVMRREVITLKARYGNLNQIRSLLETWHGIRAFLQNAYQLGQTNVVMFHRCFGGVWRGVGKSGKEKEMYR